MRYWTKYYGELSNKHAQNVTGKFREEMLDIYSAFPQNPFDKEACE